MITLCWHLFGFCLTEVYKKGMTISIHAVFPRLPVSIGERELVIFYQIMKVLFGFAAICMWVANGCSVTKSQVSLCIKDVLK